MSLRRAIFQIFDFKKCRDLEIRVRGHLRSLQWYHSIDYRLHMVSNYCPIVTLSVSFRDIRLQNAVTLKPGLRVRQGH